MKVRPIQFKTLSLLLTAFKSSQTFKNRQHSKVVEPKKRLKSITKSTIIKAVLLFTHQDAISATFYT